MTNIGTYIYYPIASAYIACNLTHLWVIRDKTPATDLTRKVCAPKLKLHAFRQVGHGTLQQSAEHGEGSLGVGRGERPVHHRVHLTIVANATDKRRDLDFAGSRYPSPESRQYIHAAGH